MTLGLYRYSFEKNPNGLLLATDVAARGLDIPNIDVIIHFQIPKTSEVIINATTVCYCREYWNVIVPFIIIVSKYHVDTEEQDE